MSSGIEIEIDLSDIDEDATRVFFRDQAAFFRDQAEGAEEAATRALYEAENLRREELLRLVRSWPGYKHGKPDQLIEFGCPVCKKAEAAFWLATAQLSCPSKCAPASIAEALRAGPPTAEERLPRSWRPADLAPVLNGTRKRPEPTLGLARTDGLRMLYPGKEHSVIGEMESGKSWFSAACCAAEMAAGRHVLYIHFEEDDPTDIVERLQILGVADETILAHFRFIGPEEPVKDGVIAELLHPVPSLVILDGVNEAMSLHGQGIREEDGAAAFRRRLVKPFTSAGAATLSADHVVKDREARGRNALGSIHKGNGLSGALIMLENAEPFGRGQRGRSRVYITKDRPGHLRRHGHPDPKLPGKTRLGDLVIDDTASAGRLRLEFTEPPLQPATGVLSATGADGTAVAPMTQRDADDMVVLDTVLTLHEQGGGLRPVTTRAVRSRTGISKDRTRDALERLVQDGDLREEEGPKNSRLYTPLCGPDHVSGGGGPAGLTSGPETVPL